MSEIPEIHVPDISPPFVYSPYVPTPIETPVIIPGCQYFHRDQNLNPNLFLEGVILTMFDSRKTSCFVISMILVHTYRY